ncbi:hypothetical protein [Flavobacterium terrae]|uniref:LTXXQ motif family protein n=1 Tax=Flavobacterium terrae TaxID=415425 RepID=A0A1M6DIL5_9FLAO|nr:hypothetical protein [Flavobacterium terrae]SHI73032.1 hypothetical protein SAMN05444363_1472 [Flavobacterium terrae]
MKKTLLIVLAIVSLSGAYAQERTTEKPRRERMTLEQRNQLQLKRMTANLDLTPSQQKEMAVIIADQNSKREAKIAEIKANKEAKKQLTADERFKMENEKLDAQIEHKAKMKKVLNKEQFEKWEKNQEKRNEKMHKMKRAHHQKSKKDAVE